MSTYLFIKKRNVLVRMPAARREKVLVRVSERWYT